MLGICLVHVTVLHLHRRCFGETLSTLNFARRTKMIKNKAVVNEDASGNVLQLQAEIKRLRHLLEKYKCKCTHYCLQLSHLFNQ